MSNTLLGQLPVQYSNKPVSAQNRIVPILILFFSALSASSQEMDYKNIFGKDWIRAEQFVAENESWMKRMSIRYHISFPVATAVIFPELVRYSALRDKIETTLLKTLYVNLGNDYANFSIGPFQMKPSFAEYIFFKAPELRGSPVNEFKRKGHTEKTADFRKSIVKDLESPESEFVYLAAFIRICIGSYRLEKSGEEEVIRILSTAYNCGPDKSLERVNEMASKKFFNTKLYGTENYSYSDVSLYWYRSFAEKSKPVY